MKFIITRIADHSTQYLAHDSCSHSWTNDKDRAMIYTIHGVDQALANKYGGTVQVL